MRNKTNFQFLKKRLEESDTFNTGLIEKVDFCRILEAVNDEYKDEDIMKFIRVTDLYENGKVNYTGFLDLLFYSPQGNQLIKIIDHLKGKLEALQNPQAKNHKKLHELVEEFFSAVSKMNPKYWGVNEAFNYLKENLSDIDKMIVCKLDLDQDGKISVADLVGVLKRYENQAFFKYENNGN